MTEKDLQKAISRVLFYGVWLCAALGLAGFALGFFSGVSGRRVMLAGLLVLLLTPVLRMALLAAGYARLGKTRFAVYAVFVLLVMLGGFLAA